MDIKYNVSGDLTIGTAVYDYCDICPGYSNLLVLAIANMATSKERDQLLNMSNMKAFSKPTKNDVFDSEVGKSIVRDKLIIRDAERQILKVSIIEKYLNKMKDCVGKTSQHHVGRMDNAYERMERFQ